MSVKNLSKVRCQRCNGKILLKTARKYEGYSRQCLAKINDTPDFKTYENPEVSTKVQDIILRQQMKERLMAVLPQEKPMYATHLGVSHEINFLQVVSEV